ncbi:MAG: LCP family protein [Defluviitaleaceae bacterium]|nr:LCP family protein [Defluviitaleaceae bacterium]
MVYIFWDNLLPVIKKEIKKILLIAGAITAGTLFLSTIGVITMLVVDGRSSPPPPPPTPTPAAIAALPYNDIEEDTSLLPDEDDEVYEPDEGGFLRPPARTNFLLIGLDDRNLADAIMVGCFYRDTGDIKLMAVPRDMYTRLPSHRLEQMQAEGLRPPSTMKINAVRNHGGRNGTYYLKQQLGEMLGVEFDYYVEVTLAAFRRIVDAIGGVYFDVPVPMIYNPNDQELFINLFPGHQRLDGAAAEQFVRFRNFPTGDLARNESQIDFMTALISQVLTRDAIMNEPMTMINIVLNDVRSNIGLDVIRYIRYIGNMSGDSITTFVMPGRGAYLGGISWFLPDAQRVPDIVNQIFYAEVQADNQDTNQLETEAQ